MLGFLAVLGVRAEVRARDGRVEDVGAKRRMLSSPLVASSLLVAPSLCMVVMWCSTDFLLVPQRVVGRACGDVQRDEVVDGSGRS